MIVECPYCHMTLLDQYNGQFRCWWCHIWLRKDQIVILGENKVALWDDMGRVDVLPQKEPGDEKSLTRFRK